MGILFLLSLGGDILEVWGEVRAVWVAAAILWGGDVGVCPGDPCVVLGRGLDLFLHTRVFLLFNGSRTRFRAELQSPILEAKWSAHAIAYAVTRCDRLDAEAQSFVAGGWECGKRRQ
jgi:hypothetical protein